MNRKTRTDRGRYRTVARLQAGRNRRRRALRRRLGPLAVASALVLLAFPSLAGQAAGAVLRPSMAGVTQATCPHDEPICMLPCPNGMTEKDGTHFRVFACDNGPRASMDEQTALSDLEALYFPETALMGDPLPDNQAAGEMGRIDVYLETGGTTGQTLIRGGHTRNVRTDDGCPCDAETPQDAINGTVSSGYIVALRPESVTDGSTFNSTLAHELFHVLQFSHNNIITCDNLWFSEASAKWAEWWFAPTTAGTNVYHPWLDSFQANPDVSLTDATSRRRPPYAAWVWPLFMQQEELGSPTPIAQAWKNMENKTGCAALNAAINQVEPFATSFGKFAVENFDSQLPNLAPPHVLAWPVDFGLDYPSTAINPGAPKFPQILPAGALPSDRSFTPSRSSYPWTVTVPVSNLLPLSAQYTKVSLLPTQAGAGNGDGGSVEFDFSGLTPHSALDVNLLAADGQASGAAVNNGVWQRIPLNGSTQAKICLNADGTKPDTPLTSGFYVILDNHSWGSHPAKVSGSYTVTQRSTCATSLTGSLTYNYKNNSCPVSGPGNGCSAHTQNASISVNLTSGPDGWQIAGPSWSVQMTEYTHDNAIPPPDPVPPCNITRTASGSGIPSSTYNDLASGSLNAYMEPYSTYPSAPDFLPERSALWSNRYACATSPPPGTSLEFSLGCNNFPHGVFLAGDNGINYDCSDHGTSGGVTFSEKSSGGLTATGAILCGLWTSNCSIASAASARDQRRRHSSPQIGSVTSILAP